MSQWPASFGIAIHRTSLAVMGTRAEKCKWLAIAVKVYARNRRAASGITASRGKMRSHLNAIGNCLSTWALSVLCVSCSWLWSVTAGSFWSCCCHIYAPLVCRVIKPHQRYARLISSLAASIQLPLCSSQATLPRIRRQIINEWGVRSAAFCNNTSALHLFVKERRRVCAYSILCRSRRLQMSEWNVNWSCALCSFIAFDFARSLCHLWIRRWVEFYIKLCRRRSALAVIGLDFLPALLSPDMTQFMAIALTESATFLSLARRVRFLPLYV